MPKFKLCKHPNGGSLQIGLDDNYMRVRVSDLFAQVPYNKYNIPTVDYKIKGYKGNLKYNITKWTPGKFYTGLSYATRI